MGSLLAQPAPIGVRVGEYEITGVLDRGGMGTVYGGIHPVIGTDVAVKVLDPRIANHPEAVARFVQEARVVNKIRHPNIIDIFAFGESPELGHYYVMPRLHGHTLHHRLAHSGPLSVSAALPILRQIAEALDAAHDAGVCHRDLKPANVFLVTERSGADVVKVLDFGVAKLSDAGPRVAVTQAGQILGTPLYMAPEQWEGTGVDHRADIYALGVLLHHMVTGRHPFESKSTVKLMNLHVGQPPALPSSQGGPPVVDAIVGRALAKDREQRFGRAGEMIQALVVAASGAAELGVAFSPTLPGVGGDDDAGASRRIGDRAPSSDPGRTDQITRTSHRWRPLGLLGGLSAVLVVIALAVVANGKRKVASAVVDRPVAAGGRDGAPVPAPRRAAPATRRTVRLRIDSIPSGASVTLDREVIGTTPFDAQVPARESGLASIRLPGYRPKEVPIPLSVEVQRTIELTRVAPATPAAGKKAARRGARTRSTWGETVNPF